MQAVQAARTNLASLKVQENSATKKKYDSMAKTVHKLPADVKESIDAAAAIFGANQVEPKGKAPKKRKWFNGAWSFFVKSYQQFFGWQSSPAGQSTNRNAGLGAPPPIPPPFPAPWRARRAPQLPPAPALPQLPHTLPQLPRTAGCFAHRQFPSRPAAGFDTVGPNKVTPVLNANKQPPGPATRTSVILAHLRSLDDDELLAATEFDLVRVHFEPRLTEGSGEDDNKELWDALGPALEWLTQQYRAFDFKDAVPECFRFRGTPFSNITLTFSNTKPAGGSWWL